MTTLADLTAEIADDIDDTTNEYGNAILKAVQGAQRDCERFTFYFNETRDKTFATVAGRGIYTKSDLADIGSLVRIQTAFLVDAAGQVTGLSPCTPEELELLSDNSAARAQPTVYAYFNQAIRLYPIPNAVHTIRLQLGPYRLTPLSQPTDNNAWLDEAYDLLKARAKYRLYKNTLKDANLAAEALNDFNEQFALTKAETSSRNGSGSVRPTEF
jgi:hypothetical protein